MSQIIERAHGATCQRCTPEPPVCDPQLTAKVTMEFYFVADVADSTRSSRFDGATSIQSSSPSLTLSLSLTLSPGVYVTCCFPVFLIRCDSLSTQFVIYIISPWNGNESDSDVIGRRESERRKGKSRTQSSKQASIRWILRYLCAIVEKEEKKSKTNANVARTTPKRDIS